MTTEYEQCKAGMVAHLEEVKVLSTCEVFDVLRRTESMTEEVAKLCVTWIVLGCSDVELWLVTLREVDRLYLADREFELCNDLEEVLQDRLDQYPCFRLKLALCRAGTSAIALFSSLHTSENPASALEFARVVKSLLNEMDERTANLNQVASDHVNRDLVRQCEDALQENRVMQTSHLQENRAMQTALLQLGREKEHLTTRLTAIEAEKKKLQEALRAKENEGFVIKRENIDLGRRMALIRGHMENTIRSVRRPRNCEVTRIPQPLNIV
jgi:hypothetical protein